MNIKQENESQQGKKFRKYVRSRFPFPSYDFGTAILLADKVENEGAGRFTEATLAISLKASAKSSGFKLRVLAARQFGLLDKQGELLVTTPRSKAILKPLSDEEKKHQMIAAFLAIPLFNEVVKRFKGQPIPPAAQFRNILERELGVEGNRSAEAYRVLLDSARDAGVLHQAGDKIYLVADATTANEPVTEVSGEPPISIWYNKPIEPKIKPYPAPVPSGISPLSDDVIDDLATVDDAEFDEIWKALGKLARIRGRRRQERPEPKELG